MQRRNFIRLIGGGTIAAATAATAAGGWLALAPTDFPPDAVEAWRGPSPGESDPRRRAVAYAITAPNPHNLQPWRVDLRTAGVITVHTDPARVLPETDPFGRQILIGHGAFVELLVLSLAQDGIGSEVTLWPQGELPATLAGWDARPVARIVLAGTASPDPLFAQVLRRHTAKSDFDTTRTVEPAVLAALLATGRPGSPARAAGTVDAERLPALRRLCEDAANVEINTPAAALESARLVRVGPAQIAQHRDGITLMSPFVRAIDALGMFDRNEVPAAGTPAHDTITARFAGHSRSAMGFVWLTTPSSGRAAQVEAGRAHVRMHLRAAALGLGLHPMSQALQEFAPMRPHYESAHRLLIDRAAPANAADPAVQMFSRLGYTRQPAAGTPRRPLEAFIA